VSARLLIVVDATGEVRAQQVADSEAGGFQAERLAQLLAPEIARLRDLVASALADRKPDNERHAA